MLFDYGTLYNITGNDTINSNAYISRMTTGTSSVRATALNTTIYGEMFLEDNELSREATFINPYDSSIISAFNVIIDSTTGSFVKRDQFGYSSNYPIHSIKKVDNNTYFTYGGLSYAAGSDLVIDFGYDTLITGSTSSTSLYTETIVRSAGDRIDFSDPFLDERKIYYVVEHKETPYTPSIGIRSGYKNYTAAVYCLNIDSNSVSVIYSITLPTMSDPYKYYIVASTEVFTSLGTVRAFTTYYEREQQDDIPTYQSIKVSTEKGITLVDETVGAEEIIIGSNFKYNYNYRDIIIFAYYTYDYSKYYYYSITSSLDVVGKKEVTGLSNVPYPDTQPITFRSASVYPKIGFVGTTFYWLDNQGRRTTAITLAGVSTIHSIFPTLDTITGGVYVIAVMSAGGTKFLLVNPYTGDIITDFVIPTFPYFGATTNVFNHGNFFITQNSTFHTVRVVYLVNVTPISGVGDVQMIVETN